MRAAVCDTETTPKTWDHLCKDCKSEGPFYGRDRVCTKCRYRRRREHEATHEDSRQATLRRNREFINREHRRRRVTAIAVYGGFCTCCGESELAFLVIDHVGGGGNAHRRSLSASGKVIGSSNFYRWLEANGWPEGFQVLCHNCNFAKSHGGCPHAGSNR